MNKKAQIGGQVGAIIMVFITVIVGVILLTAVAQEAGETTTLSSYDNKLITLPVAGATTYITTDRYMTGVSMTNRTDAVVVTATNYTITNNVVYNGALAIKIDLAAGSPFSAEPVNLTATTVQPLTYIPESGSRSLVPLIAIFFALAIVVVTMSPVLENEYVRNMVGR